MEDKTISNIFGNRLRESNIFTEDEICLIEKDKMLYERCYLLGILDR